MSCGGGGGKEICTGSIVNNKNNNNNNNNTISNSSATNNKICTIDGTLAAIGGGGGGGGGNNAAFNTSCTCIAEAHTYSCYYDDDGDALESGVSKARTSLSFPLRECNAQCECDEATCANRVVQSGCPFALEVFDTASVSDHSDGYAKGKGVRSSQERIAAGSFVVEYVGELIGVEEAERRLEERTRLAEANYIMFVREHFAADHSTHTTALDARNYGNVARFINHSCEPNMCLVPVRIESVVPHAALFAIRDIGPLEELTYDYNALVGDEAALCSGTPCRCGSARCRGFLPT